jgi:hypothetical protein
MPTNAVKTPKDEKRWKKARNLARAAGKADNYAYVMGIYNRMMEKGVGSAYSGSGTRTGSPGHYDYRYNKPRNRSRYKVGKEGDIGGIKLTSKGDAWAFVHRSSKRPGMWQASFFDSPNPDPSKPVPDSQFKTAQDAVDSVIEMGYVVEDTLKKGTFYWALVSGRIFKARPYQGRGRREGSEGNYRYVYDDEKGVGGKKEERVVEDKEGVDDDVASVRVRQEAARLHMALAGGMTAFAGQILSTLAPGSAALLTTPLTALYSASTEKEREKIKSDLDKIRERQRGKRGEGKAEKKETKTDASNDREDSVTAQADVASKKDETTKKWKDEKVAYEGAHPSSTGRTGAELRSSTATEIQREIDRDASAYNKIKEINSSNMSKQEKKEAVAEWDRHTINDKRYDELKAELKRKGVS